MNDSSLISTLKNRLLERMRSSKHILLIATEFASINRGLLNWEIEKAVELYGLPIIVIYPEYDYINQPSLLSNRWPEKLIEYIEQDKVKTIHIPFKQSIIDQAINDFSIHNPPQYNVTIYSDKVYKEHGLID